VIRKNSDNELNSPGLVVQQVFSAFDGLRRYPALRQPGGLISLHDQNQASSLYPSFYGNRVRAVKVHLGQVH